MCITRMVVAIEAQCGGDPTPSPTDGFLQPTHARLFLGEQHDLLDIMRKLVPDFREEHQYRHSGPIHAQFGRYVNEPGDFTSMNTDGHLRSVFFGRSETMTIKDGKLDGGEFAHIYFIDWDQVRARHRQLNVTVMGTTEEFPEGSRKFNNGEVINTLHKFLPEEKAYDVHYTLQQQR